MGVPTLQDIATDCGLSLATVDRVINQRGGVRSRTRTRVIEAGQRLGYFVPGDPLLTSPLAPVRLAVLLPQGTNAFINELDRQVMLQAAGLDGVQATVHRAANFDALELARQISALGATHDGLALVAIDNPAVREAIRRLRQSGTGVVTLASDISGVAHLGYIGIDNAQAGRLGGYLLGRLLGRERTAKVAFFAGSVFYRGHQEREIGFRQILAEEFQNLTLTDVLQVHEDRQQSFAALRDLLERHPDLAGIYNAGGATAGIAAALLAAGKAQSCVLIAHDATPNNKTLLLNGTLDAVIDQNARAEVREALTTLARAARGQSTQPVPPRLQVIFRENLPQD